MCKKHGIGYKAAPGLATGKKAKKGDVEVEYNISMINKVEKAVGTEITKEMPNVKEWAKVLGKKLSGEQIDAACVKLKLKPITQSVSKPMKVMKMLEMLAQ